jgi:predicted nucleic acid-binding protein
MSEIFVDTDVVLDLLARREPFYSPAAQLFSLAENRALVLAVSPLTFSNLFYILRKIGDRKEAIKSLQKLKLLVKILSVSEKAVERALASNFRDFEDAIQYYTAIENGIHYLITRNTKDYQQDQIAVLTPQEFLKIRKVKQALKPRRD